MISVRVATAADIPIINQIGNIAFYATYLPFIKEDQVDYMFDKMYSEVSLRQQMEVCGAKFLLILEHQQALGFAAYQLNFLEDTTKLHKLYILPKCQTKGLGRKLMEQMEQNAAKVHQKKIILNVNRYNSALGFYKKLGYSIFKEDDIDIGNGYFMNDYEMIKIFEG